MNQAQFLCVGTLAYAVLCYNLIIWPMLIISRPHHTAPVCLVGTLLNLFGPPVSFIFSVLFGKNLWKFCLSHFAIGCMAIFAWSRGSPINYATLLTAPAGTVTMDDPTTRGIAYLLIRINLWVVSGFSVSYYYLRRDIETGMTPEFRSQAVQEAVKQNRKERRERVRRARAEERGRDMQAGGV